MGRVIAEQKVELGRSAPWDRLSLGARLGILMGIIVYNTEVIFAETLPVTIEVTKDVSGLDGSHSWQKKGNLYSNRAFQIRKGERFQMIEVFSEGECRIRYRGNEYNLSSCPWLPGFTDHQSETFVVVPPN